MLEKLKNTVFKANLELVRQGILHVVQESNFEDIIIKKQTETDKTS